MNIIKANRYRIVDNSSFEMPLPLKFTVWKSDAPVCEYIVSEDEQVSYHIITRYKELMITTIHRPLDISDIFYLFSCRVFQDKTPFTYPILERMGLEKYNVLNILERTHGVTPYDDYWLCFDGEKLTYEQAESDYEKFLISPETHPVPLVSYPAGEVPAEVEEKPVTADVNEILHQQKVNVSEIIAENNKPVQIAPEVSYEPERVLENNKMSEDEIEALLRSCGITGDDSDDDPDASDEASEPDDKPSGGKMSQEDIEKMLAAVQAPAESEPVPAEPDQPSGGKMSQEDIEKLLAATSQPEPISAETKSEEEPSGGKMSQEDIEKMLAAMQAPAEPEPVPAEPVQPSGGKMSQEDIEKLLAATSQPEPISAETKSEEEPSGGKMSQEDIEKMLAAMQAPAEPEPVPAPEPEPASGGKMSQEDIEKMLAAMQAPAEPEPVPAEPEQPSGGKMSQEDIEKMLAAMQAPAEPEPAPAEPEQPSGGKMSQDDIEALLNSMQEEATKK